MDDSVLEWSVDQVGTWLSTIGYDKFKTKFKNEGVDGEVLVNLNHETLLDLTMQSVGKRILMLKAIYELKLRYQLPVYSDDYSPPADTEDPKVQDDMFGGYYLNDVNLISAFKDRDLVIKRLVTEVDKLTHELAKVKSIIQINQSQSPVNPELTLTKANKNRPAPIVTNLNQPKQQHYLNNNNKLSNKKVGSPLSPRSPSVIDGLSTNSSRPGDLTPLSGNLLSGSDLGDTIKVYGHRLQYRENEVTKSFKICMDDPCHKVIPAALKKYKINDDWKNYSLFISQASGEERKLELEEKPMIIYQQLKDAKQAPVFVLKLNGKDTPITHANAHHIQSNNNS